MLLTRTKKCCNLVTILFVVVLLCRNSYAQQQEDDISLLKKNLHNDTISATYTNNTYKIADKIADSYWNKSPDSLKKYINILLNVAYKLNDDTLIAKTHSTIAGTYLGSFNDPYLAAHHHGLAIKHFLIAEQKPRFKFYYYINLGNMYYRFKLYDLAINTYQQAIDESEYPNYNDCNYSLSVAYDNMAMCLREQKQYNSALILFKRGLDIRKKINPLFEAHNTMYIANVYFRAGKLDSAQHYADYTQKCLNQGYLFFNCTDRKNDSIFTKTLFFQIKADLHFLKANMTDKKNNDWIINLDSALFFANAINDLEMSCNLLLTKSDIYMSRNEWQTAEMQILNAADLVQNKHDLLLDCYRRLINIAHATNDMQKTDLYQAKYIATTDSVFLYRQNEQIISRNLLLNNSLLTENIRMLEHQQQADQREKMFIYVVLVLVTAVVFLLLIFVVVLRRRNSDLKQAHQDLVLRNREINTLLESTDVQQKIELQISNIEHKPSDPVYPDIVIAENTETQNVTPIVMSDDDANKLVKKLVQLMNTQKIYTNKDLTLKYLADSLDTNTAYVSFILNQRLGQRFQDFINEWRVKEARRIILEHEFDNRLNIETIGEMVGFNSRSAFYAAFKKFTGLTPAMFIRDNKNTTH